MSARDVVRRIPTYLAFAVLCFAMFDVPSAYVYWRGWPWGLALAIGLVVFPALPVGWHLYSERKAKKAEKPKPRKTKGIERFLFKTIAVALIVVGGLIAIARGRVWTALKNDALWFIPTSIGSLQPDSKLLDKVPPSAQFVVWVRPTDDAKALVGKVAPGTPVFEIVAAGRQVDKTTDAIVLERGDVLIPLIEKMQATILSFTAKNGITLPENGAVVGESDGVKTWSTSGWAKEIGTGRSTAIELMKRAPEDAFLVAVGNVPAKPPMVTSPLQVVVWVRAPREHLEADVTIEAADEATAILLYDEANREIAKMEKKEAEGMGCWRKHSDELFFRREGTKLHAKLEIDLDGIKGMLSCVDMSNM